MNSSLLIPVSFISTIKLGIKQYNAQPNWQHCRMLYNGEALKFVDTPSLPTSLSAEASLKTQFMIRQMFAMSPSSRFVFFIDISKLRSGEIMDIVNDVIRILGAEHASEDVKQLLKSSVFLFTHYLTSSKLNRVINYIQCRLSDIAKSLEEGSFACLFLKKAVKW